jgi:hypothetical protein
VKRKTEQKGETIPCLKSEIAYLKLAPHVQNNHNHIINAKRSYRIFRTYSGVLDNKNSLSTLLNIQFSFEKI